MTSFCLDEFNVFWVSGSKDSGTAELKDAFDLQMTTLTMPFDSADALMRPSMTTRVQHSLGHPPPQRSTPLRPLNPIPFWRNPLPVGIFAHDAFKSFVEALEKRDGGVLPADLSGLSVIDSYQLLQQGRELTEDETFLASALGWCIEWLQAFFLVLDNIMDGSHTRRGQPCWFRLPKVSMIAVNDGVVLRNHIPRILIKYFREKPYYVDLLDLFNEVEFQTSSGEELKKHIEKKKILVEMETNSIESSSRFEGIVELAIERLELHVLANRRFKRYNNRFCSGGGQYKFYFVKSTSAKT
ncbi:hypothetical protein PS1_037544 [Malus domestica]